MKGMHLIISSVLLVSACLFTVLPVAGHIKTKYNMELGPHTMDFVMAPGVGISSSNGLVFGGFGREKGQSELQEAGTRIKGGTEISISEYPFMASIQVLWTDGNLYHICGGSLVNESKVVTTAHCMLYWPQLDHYVALGVQHISIGGEELIKVQNVTSHSDFNINSVDFGFNVAVLELERPAMLSSKVQVGTLASRKDPSYDHYQDCEVLGWGKDESGQLTDGLNVAVLFGITNNDCRRFLRIFRFYGLQQHHKCAFNWPSAACQGDSGGPLVCEGLIVGLSSYGVTGCTGCFPGIYTRASYFRNWILRQ